MKKILTILILSIGICFNINAQIQPTEATKSIVLKVPFNDKTEYLEQLVKDSLSKINLRIYSKSQIDSITNKIRNDYQLAIDNTVISFNGRKGDITPSDQDYAAFYKPLNYVPSWDELINKPIIPDISNLTPLTKTQADSILLKNLIDTKIDKTEKGVANGVATLDGAAKIHVSQIPDALIGAVNYQGNYNASNNTPSLPANPTMSSKGQYYVVATAGTQFGIDFKGGDWIISNGTEWQKVDNNNVVTSVAGKVGAVALNPSDVGLDDIDNTSDLAKPISIATQNALNLKVDKAGTKQLSDENYTTTEKNKLAGIATSATANSTDAQLRDRSTHTGTQDASTIVESATKRFVTDTEKAAWNAKLNSADISGLTPLTKTKADSIALRTEINTKISTSVANSTYATITQLNAKANDNEVVKLTGNQTVTDKWLKNSIIGFPGELDDLSMTGLYDRNELTFIDKRGTVSVSFNNGGSFTSIPNLFDAKGSPINISGMTEGISEMIIDIDNLTSFPVYSRAQWVPFVQFRSSGHGFFKKIEVFTSSDGVNYTSGGANWTFDYDAGQRINVVNMWQGANAMGGYPFRYVRFKLSKPVLHSSGNLYIIEVGLRHASSPYARQYVRADGDDLYGDYYYKQTPNGAGDIATLNTTTGRLQKRTPAQVLTDIGAEPKILPSNTVIMAAGSYTKTATAETSFIVPIGTTQANTAYRVMVTPTSSTATEKFYISNKTTTNFTVTFTSAVTGQVTFDWITL